MPCVCDQLLSPFFFCNFFYCYSFVFFAFISSFPSPRLGASSPLFYLCARTLQTASPSQSSEPLCLPRKELRAASPAPLATASISPPGSRPPEIAPQDGAEEALTSGVAESGSRGEAGSPAAAAASSGPQAPLRASPSSPG